MTDILGLRLPTWQDVVEREYHLWNRHRLVTNQSKVIHGEDDIVVNYKANSAIRSIWVLWNAEDRFFRRVLKVERAISQPRRRRHIEVIFASDTCQGVADEQNLP